METPKTGFAVMTLVYLAGAASFGSAAQTLEQSSTQVGVSFDQSQAQLWQMVRDRAEHGQSLREEKARDEEEARARREEEERREQARQEQSRREEQSRQEEARQERSRREEQLQQEETRQERVRREEEAQREKVNQEEIHEPRDTPRTSPRIPLPVNKVAPSPTATPTPSPTPTASPVSTPEARQQGYEGSCIDREIERAKRKISDKLKGSESQYLLEYVSKIKQCQYDGKGLNSYYQESCVDSQVKSTTREILRLVGDNEEGRSLRRFFEGIANCPKAY